FAFDEEGRRGLAIQSIVSEGSIVSGATVVNSVLGRGVFVHSYSLVEWSVIMDNCHIHRHARVRRTIIDKNVRVPQSDTMGFDLERDRQRCEVAEGGFVVIPKGYVFAGWRVLRTANCPASLAGWITAAAGYASNATIAGLCCQHCVASWKAYASCNTPNSS